MSVQLLHILIDNKSDLLRPEIPRETNCLDLERNEGRSNENHPSLHFEVARRRCLGYD